MISQLPQLESLIRQSGVGLTTTEEGWKGLCPFHPDTTQSLIVDPEQNRWECSVCQIGGSVVDWVMKAEGVSRSHAEELILKQYQTTSTRGAIVEYSSVRHLDAPFDSSQSDKQILEHVVHYYHEVLKDNPKVQARLLTMGMTGEAVDYFQLGFADRSFGKKMPEKNRIEGGALRGRLQRLGILKPSGHELFHGSLVVQIIENHRIVQIYGHKITKKLRPGTPIDTYLHPGSGFFHCRAIEVSEELIVCPSIIDALVFWCAGYKNVTAPYGVSNASSIDIACFESSPVRRVLFAYPADQASQQLVQLLHTQFAERGIDTYRLEFPQHMSAQAYALSQSSASEALGNCIRQAVWLGKGQPPVKTALPSTEKTVDAAEPIAEVPMPEVTHDDAKETASDPLPATVMPSVVTEMIDAEVTDTEILMTLEDRRYRIRGLDRNTSLDQLKVNLLVSKQEAIHIDTFDLYTAKARLNYIKQAALELRVPESVMKNDISKLVLKAESLQTQFIQQTRATVPVPYPMTSRERDEAMGLLTSPILIRRILRDFETCGIVGETTNKLVSYLATLSRKLDKPLAIIIQSSSAAGKSALMEAVLAFVPDEEQFCYSKMTGQSLFYMGDINLRHKILAISEEEGARHATYSLKLLQSEGQLTIASTGKDPNSGRHVTLEYKVEGPVMIFSTTTAIDIDDELLNRCLVLTVDEDREQTRAIHDFQRYEETLEGLQASQARRDILRIHRNAQRLLKPLQVVNPYARYLTFLDDKTRTRRDHKKYLTLIRSIALLHQYQREVHTTYVNGKEIAYVEVSLDDIALANSLAHDVLGRSLDELPPQTRRLLLLIDDMVTQYADDNSKLRRDIRFTRRDVRAYVGWGDTQLKVHLQRLEAMEYLLIHRGGRGRQIVYELLYKREGQDGKPFLMGLCEVDDIKQAVAMENRSDAKVVSAESSRGDVGTVSRPYRSVLNNAKPTKHNQLDDDAHEDELDDLIKENTQYGSYAHVVPSSSSQRGV